MLSMTFFPFVFVQIIITDDCSTNIPGLWSSNVEYSTSGKLPLLSYEKAVSSVFYPTSKEGKYRERQEQVLLNPLHKLYSPGQLGALSRLKLILKKEQFDQIHVVQALQVDEYEGMSYDSMSSPAHVDKYVKRLLESKERGLVTEGLENLINLFLLHRHLRRPTVESTLGPEVVAALVSLGVFADGNGQGILVSTVQLVPLSDNLSHIFTDYHQTTKGLLPPGQYPVMYLGVDSLALVAYTRRSKIKKGRHHLDLCTGSGVQAIAALANYAKSAVLVDISTRATLFSRVNLFLNGYSYNSKVMKGDLYKVLEHLEDTSFDVITANPPYLPNPGNMMSMELFGDGGNDGEKILSAVVKGASSHLADGGSVFIVANLMSVDTYESRLKSWWQGKPVSFEMYRGHIWSQDTYAKMMDEGERKELIQAALQDVGVYNAAAGFIFIRQKPELKNNIYKAIQPHTHLWQALAGFDWEMQKELLEVIGL